MLTWLKRIAEIVGVFKLLAGLWGPIQEAIKLVEVPGFGAEKKQAVLDLVAQIVATVDLALPGVELPDELILGFAGNVIDILVALYNLAGVFTHGEEGAQGNA